MLKGENIILLKNRVNVHWGGFSQVRATLLLLQEAIKRPFDYAALISGKDYPVKPNVWLTKKLKEGGEFIQLKKIGTDPYAPLSRYKYYYFTDYFNRRDKENIKTKFFLALQKSMRRFKIAKNIPFQIYTGACWFILSEKCIKYILEQVQSRAKLLQFFKSGFCPDEGFFQTIIGNSKFAKEVKYCMTYADWSVDPGPAILSENHFEILDNLNQQFFARKFNEQSIDLLQKVDTLLRGI